jgi:KUP system potassium uptake protein
LAEAPPGEVVRVPGTAVFLYSQPGITPPSLAAHVRASGALHEHVYVVSVVGADVPRVHPLQRVDEQDVGAGIHAVRLCYGFMEQTTVADDLQAQLHIAPSSTDYFLGRETVRATQHPGMARWREVLYTVMTRNASDVGAFFHLPPDRVVEIGVRVEI